MSLPTNFTSSTSNGKETLRNLASGGTRVSGCPQSLVVDKSAVEKKFVLAIDQGTTSSRAIVFDHNGSIVGVGQKEHRQIFPRAGWVEHDAVEIWENVRQVVAGALADAQVNFQSLAAVGITNQRETVVVWDRHTGLPVYNAIVWQDTRTDAIVKDLARSHPDGLARYQDICGLPLATYFTAPKVKWILDNVPGARERAQAGDLLLGTMDSWIVWNMTGGSTPPASLGADKNVSEGLSATGLADSTVSEIEAERLDFSSGRVHVTDVTNASRTMLMDIRTLQWREDICADFGIPLSMLPEIKPSIGVFGVGRENGMLAGVPIAAILGDQQAATFGQGCFTPGSVKNTYGTGCFMLMNTGETVVPSQHGLLSTLCYQMEGEAPVYALEGSVAVAGSLVQWMRDNLGLLENAAQIEELALSVADNGGVYFVPAFSGLFAPYWRDDARGAVLGLTRYNTKAHLARAVLEAAAYQTREVLEAMRADAGLALDELRVDGAMVANQTLMQFQADILGIKVAAPQVLETTALGAAYGAGLAVGYWDNLDELATRWRPGKSWEPEMNREQAERKFRLWQKAVKRTFAWVDDDVVAETQ